MSKKDKRDLIEGVPVNIITGALGVGKTTAIAHLLNHVRPRHERWAILVNEVGQVGLDEALLVGGGEEEGALKDGVALKQVPGGCICCTNGVMFQMHLTLLLRQSRPDRLIIEPTGVAEPGSILEMLRGRAFADVLDIRATITLVDPARLDAIEGSSPKAYALEQVDVADVLVANKVDLCSPEDLLRFEAFATSWFPPKEVVATTSEGELLPEWLDIKSAACSGNDREGERPSRAMAPAAPALVRVVMQRPEKDDLSLTYDAPHTGRDRHVRSAGWLFEPSRVFFAARLRSWMESLEGELEGAMLRVKGVLQTERGWVSFNLIPGHEIEARPTAYRRDARLEVLVSSDGLSPPDWSALHTSLLATLCTPEEIERGVEF